jgi:hypothetical protein
MEYLVFGCRCLLLVVFAFSAFGKLSGAGAFTEFRQATAQLFPPARGFASWLAAAVVVAELVVVVLLGISATVRSGLVAALALLVLFTVAIAVALRRGSTAPCRCFGRSDSPLGVRHLVRNVVLLLVAFAGLTVEAAAATEPLGLVMAGLAAVVFAVLVLSFDAIADLFLERIPS